MISARIFRLNASKCNPHQNPYGENVRALSRPCECRIRIEPIWLWKVLEIEI